MILVVLVDAFGVEEFAEKLGAVKYSSTLLILSPHALIRDLTSLTTNPTNAGPNSFWASASKRIDSRVSGLLAIRM